MNVRKKISRMLTLMLMAILMFGINSQKAMAVELIFGDLHDGGINQAYSATCTVNNVPDGYHITSWALTSGALPHGLVLNTNTGEISGTPTMAESCTFKIIVYMNNGQYFSSYGHNYTITISAEPPRILPQDNTSTKTGTLCNHDYQWETEIEPTDTTDGEEQLKCTKCGNVIGRQTISAYPHFLESSIKKISAAKDGDTITITSNTWNSYPKAMFEAIAARPDLTVKIQFPDSKHIMYELTLTSEQAKAIADDYTGPEKMKALGATMLVK